MRRSWMMLVSAIAVVIASPVSAQTYVRSGNEVSTTNAAVQPGHGIGAGSFVNGQAVVTAAPTVAATNFKNTALSVSDENRIVGDVSTAGSYTGATTMTATTKTSESSKEDASTGTSDSTSAGPSTPVLLAVAAACVAAIGAVAVIKKRAENALSTPRTPMDDTIYYQVEPVVKPRHFKVNRQLTPPVQILAIQAILSFVEECAVESIASSGLSELTPSAAVFSSPSDAPPLEFLTVAAAPFVGSSDHPSGSTANENLAALSSPMAFTVPMGAQNCQPATRKRKPSRPRKSQANPNRIRNELRFELAFLREKAAQMEQELNSLKLKTQQDSTSISCRVKTPTVLIVPRGGSTQGLDAWKGIANRQRKRREDVERENTRLKLIVERQRKVAVLLPVARFVDSVLMRTVSKTSALTLNQVAECSHVKDPRAAEHHLVRVLDFTGDINDFRGLFGHLEAAYAEVDVVLASNGLATMDTPTNDVHIREGVDGRYLEFFANKVMPFGLRDTAEAAWDHFKGAEKHCGNGGLYEKAAKVSNDIDLFEEYLSIVVMLNVPDTSVYSCIGSPYVIIQKLDQPFTVIEEFTKELYSNSSRADIKVKQIVRRYVETERDIIVFVSSVAPIEIKHEAIFGLTYHLRGYVVTKKSPAATPGHELSMLQFCSRISIDKEPGILYDPDDVRAGIRFLIGNTVGNIRCYQERIENSLVDHALTRQF
ncbi:hypothetical protein ON010_g4863 [Phytophthora cinnamomi]|nr:hypothetical protein ON010_g4863 [Phytophthora cinnamomi]